MAVKNTYSKKTTTENQETSNESVATKQKKYADDDGIVCESITSGELGMIGAKSGNSYTWTCRGDETEVEYADLVAAIRSNKTHVFSPLFIIKDEEFLSKFPQVTKVYDSMYTLSDFEEVFALPAMQMKEVISSLPSGVQKSMINLASTMVANGRLDSVQKIKILDEMFDTKLMLMTELLD